MEKEEKIFGHVERITYQDLENGFTVAQLKQSKQHNLTCIVGVMPSLCVGEVVECSGEWAYNNKHGTQFKVEQTEVRAPADEYGMQKYLGSGLIKGIGKIYAEKIVEKFHMDTLDVIENNPEKLLGIGGIGKKRISSIKRCWDEQRSIRDVMIFLQGHGVSPAYAQKIFRRYGGESIKKVTDNPYVLAWDIFGIGFRMADNIAQNLGIAKDSEKRIEAGIIFVMSQLSDEGHVCYPVNDFLPRAQKALEIDSELIKARLGVLEINRRISQESLFVDGEHKLMLWLRALYCAEMGISNEIGRLKKMPCALRSVDGDKAIQWAQTQMDFQLAPNQHVAVAKSLEDKLHIITGGPGTGKSTITNVILTICAKLTKKIMLAAPTGRAAKRLAEITGFTAKTIHSLLEFDFRVMGFKRNKDNLLDCDLLIVDESSMIDTSLMYSLLKAIPDSTRVILVGDIDQLPSVGPGNVLRDIIDSRAVSVTRLTEIFRQAEGSKIVVNAHKINSGAFPDIRHEYDSDFFFLEKENPEDIVSTILGLVTGRLPRRYGFNPIDDIQVMAPMKRGIVGVDNLNRVLQKELNPNRGTFALGGRLLLPNDKVMQIRNNYDKEVFNGDVGRITLIEEIERQVHVDIDGRDIIYSFSELDELVLAYAVSVHKYQGSECPCVVMPVHTTHYMLLHRNLLYTGVTRGKKLVVLVGTKKALSLCVRNNQVKQRYTGLRQALLQ
jgi:exodeoxyribonuclease V alpha subunit